MRNPRLILTACLALAACDDSTGPAGEGTLVVSVSTSGGDPDLDGYTVRIDGAVSLPLAPHGSVTLVVRIGRRSLELEGLAPNCGVEGDARRAVDVSAGAAVHLGFTVRCDATGIRVSITADGLDFDQNGFVVTAGGQSRGVGPNAVVDITRLALGSHAVVLSDVAPNCLLQGPATATVTVANRELVPVAFALTCVALSGIIVVRVATTGVDPDASYIAILDGNPGYAAAVANGTGTMTKVPPGTHQVSLDGIAANCSITGEAVRSATITTGAAVRDTAVVDFAVSCVSDSGVIRVTTATTGIDPDGQYTATLLVEDCWYYYYCDYAVISTTPIGANDSAELTARAGSYRVRLDNVASHCGVAGSSLSPLVEVATGGQVEVHFDVGCGPPLVRVSAPTTGANPDTEYTVTLWYQDYLYYYGIPIELGVLEASGSLTAEAPFAGYFWMSLGGVAENCTVQVPNPTPAFYLANGATHDVAFPVTCGP